MLKIAKAQRQQRETTVAADAKARTRAAALQDAHQKVHFTRRLHQISGGGVARLASSAPFPSRIRIKPQRYRNGENPPGLPTSQALPPPCCASTQGHARELESEIRPCPQNQSPPYPEPEAYPQPAAAGDLKVEPGEQGGWEEKRETQGGKAGNLTVYVTLNPSRPGSSNVSVCSVNSTTDIKSECNSTETFELPPPSSLHSSPAPSTSSPGTTTSSFSSSPKEEGKRSKSSKASVFSKNVSKCMVPGGTTICLGDIVWAKIYGFPWWPARVLVITVSRKDNGLLVRQEARVAWFGSPTTSFLALSQVAPFLENFQSRFDKKRKGPYRRAVTEAAKAAKQLTPEVRALLTQFET
ncbi:hypothetical protein AAFF_G00247040 [Aldrovandia affinis]|uniref:PWWP domain-containing protein n=1 Tax=Aldrovandia affinis TaxID=143900 RepID=A0AAD7SUC7_9TELE|nr:hypothetical protein AAFF_G00247040 [Aldrovandia affinis]